MTKKPVSLCHGMSVQPEIQPEITSSSDEHRWVIRMNSVPMPFPRPCSYVITGATSGLGEQLVRKLIERRQDARITLGVRNVELARSQVDALAEEFPDADVHGRVTIGPRLDLGDAASVAAFAQSIEGSAEPLHVLVNNAGTNQSTPAGASDARDFPEIISVNYLGPFLLTLLLEDKLKRGAGGAELPSRVINVSSVTHRFSTLEEGILDAANETVIDMFMRTGKKARAAGNKDDARSSASTAIPRLYADTKLGNALFTEWLNGRWEGTRLRAMSVDPGGVITGIWRNSRWEGSRVMSWLFAPASDGSEALYDCCVDPLHDDDAPTQANLYARGAFRSPLLGWYPPRSTRLGLVAGLVAAVDWPLRRLSGGRVANTTGRVVASEACYHPETIARLGDATEEFVRGQLR